MTKCYEEAPKAAQQTKARESFHQAFKEMYKTFSAMNAWETPEAQAAEEAYTKAKDAFDAFCNSEFARQQTNNGE
jgi:predicted secreted protein